MTRLEGLPTSVPTVRFPCMTCWVSAGTTHLPACLLLLQRLLLLCLEHLYFAAQGVIVDSRTGLVGRLPHGCQSRCCPFALRGSTGCSRVGDGVSGCRALGEQACKYTARAMNLGWSLACIAICMVGPKQHTVSWAHADMAVAGAPW